MSWPGHGFAHTKFLNQYLDWYSEKVTDYIIVDMDNQTNFYQKISKKAL